MKDKLGIASSRRTDARIAGKIMGYQTNHNVRQMTAQFEPAITSEHAGCAGHAEARGQPVRASGKLGAWSDAAQSSKHPESNQPAN